MGSSLNIGAPVTRRGFLASLAAGSLVLAARVSPASTLLAVVGQDGSDTAFEPNLWLSIDPSGAVTIVTHRSEMGTGIRTSLPMVVADELEADWARVTLRQAIGDARYGDQNTDGSRSVRQFYEVMRVAGAAARTLLERAAAEIWGVDAAECKARLHEVHHAATGRSIGFGELVARARTLEAPAEGELTFKTPAERRYVGQPVPIVDLADMVTGRATFGIDARREGQLFAVVARSPVLGAPLKSVDDTAAREVAGVVDVLTIPGYEGVHGFQPLGGVAVLANSTWAAIAGRKALKLEWGESDNDSYDSEAFEREMVATSRRAGTSWRTAGDTAAAFEAADEGSVHEADYYVPLLAHASMEPPAAVAEVTVDEDGKAIRCEAWAATQNPQAAQEQVAATLGLELADVIVNVTLLGGGFGRKSKPDYVAEAAWLSRATRRPVHVTWTREDDIRHDYYHTVAAVHMRAAVDERGMPTAWLQRSVFPPIFSTFAPGMTSPSDFELALGFTDVPYVLPNLTVESGDAPAHVRIGWLRSVAHIYHALAVCSFPDELARRAGRDPYEYLMELLGEDRLLDLEGVQYPNQGESLERYPFDVGRLKAVTKRVAQMAGWGRELPKGKGLGIACHRSFLSYYATVVEVDVDRRGALTIPKVWSVLDAGLILNPDRVRAQMEGATAFGASLALHGEITAVDGAIQQSNFHDYKVARMYDSPRAIECEIVSSEALPGGVGETGVPPFAPALCNAIAAATGVRVRRLPISKTDLRWS
ncbi:xanthine dehydrogenase family protein molybdopterin-binding subunit [Engelhardtia mirabilis]|uniref:Membrane-bound aldehyde dehydrogenase [pyrroloquinoline-quinone] n=1 Tax=Engelhardtia mirabilis TaxID=2528011 RepID=A0A518BDG1_9BACT|nr:Membrane-bound aldehyde dehydrogenase [pyrroloquinoline-quinone] precursor [Planctomycetes bacterium Pla133]QDU99345.1 Membrane-bound aldehyde dehydrogenase [pyrroloquinoline-quinone] precursor [Planctomycetes bacterium Pla86]